MQLFTLAESYNRPRPGAHAFPCLMIPVLEFYMAYGSPPPKKHTHTHIPFFCGLAKLTCLQVNHDPALKHQDWQKHQVVIHQPLSLSCLLANHFENTRSTRNQGTQRQSHCSTTPRAQSFGVLPPQNKVSFWKIGVRR